MRRCSPSQHVWLARKWLGAVTVQTSHPAAFSAGLLHAEQLFRAGPAQSCSLSPPRAKQLPPSVTGTSIPAISSELEKIVGKAQSPRSSRATLYTARLLLPRPMNQQAASNVSIGRFPSTQGDFSLLRSSPRDLRDPTLPDRHLLKKFSPPRKARTSRRGASSCTSSEHYPAERAPCYPYTDYHISPI